MIAPLNVEEDLRNCNGGNHPDSQLRTAITPLSQSFALSLVTGLSYTVAACRRLKMFTAGIDLFAESAAVRITDVWVRVCVCVYLLYSVQRYGQRSPA